MSYSLHTLNEKYNCLKERAEWLRNYTTYISNITKRSADLYFRSTEIPRDNRWKDDLIHELVEIADRSRKSSDEFAEKIEKNVIENLVELETEISKFLLLMKNEIKCNIDEEDGLYLELKYKIDFHKKAWTNKEMDPWLSEFDLKNTVDKYFELRDEKKRHLNVKKRNMKIITLILIRNMKIFWFIY